MSALEPRKNTWLILLPYLSNKYVLCLLFFITWISFFDKNNLFVQARYRAELNDLRTERNYLEAEIARNQADLAKLMSDAGNLERYAREKFYMKKPNEDIYVVVRPVQPLAE